MEDEEVNREESNGNMREINKGVVLVFFAHVQHFNGMCLRFVAMAMKMVFNVLFLGCCPFFKDDSPIEYLVFTYVSVSSYNLIFCHPRKWFKASKEL